MRTRNSKTLIIRISLLLIVVLLGIMAFPAAVWDLGLRHKAGRVE